MTATDCYANVEHTFDAPTAVTRLDIVLRGLPRDGGTIAALLFQAGVRGVPERFGYSPIESYLHARIGCDVFVGVNLTLATDSDWTFSMPTPQWLREFADDCMQGLHPLIEGEPCTGSVRVLDHNATART